MAFKPVCNGSETDFRCITPGAGVSTGRRFICYGFLQDHQLVDQVGSQPDQSRLHLQGTSMILPVRRTVSPSRISVKVT